MPHSLSRIHRLSIAMLAALLASATPARPDEGMWTFNNLPIEQLRQKHGFDATDAWVRHVMRASVRFNNGGSGSFVSSDGLVLTNHHIAADTLQKISTPEHDLYTNGFYATSLAQEIPAPDLEIDVLQSIDDVTARVNAAVTPGMGDADAYQARLGAMAAIEAESLAATGLRSDVVTLYQGGQYQLYRYKKYTDIRIVFAPEFAAAFFGGDPDNFEYPRFDLDMAIFRVYENGRPARIDDFLGWSATGPSERDLIFVAGNPGRTERALTVSALTSLRDSLLPYKLDVLHRREANIAKYRAQGTEQARRGEEVYFGIQNSRKAYDGRLAGLKDAALMAAKQGAESSLISGAQARPDLAPLVRAWSTVTAAEAANAKLNVERDLLETGSAFDSDLFVIARHLVRIAAEDPKPNGQRLPEYRQSSRESLLEKVLSPAPVFADLEQARLAQSLSFLVEKLGVQNDSVKTALQGQSAGDRAEQLAVGTNLYEVAVRKALLAGGAAAIAQSRDPMIRLAAAIDAASRAVRARYEAEVSGPEQQAYGDLAKIRFAIFGTSIYPDATSSPRLAFGLVEGYPQDGGQIPAFTDFAGAFSHETAHGGADPYQLPASWHHPRSPIDPAQRLDFVSSADIIGGNSGSPVINATGELVGLIFDGNIQSLAGDLAYDGAQNRAVAVDSAGMLEALHKIYGADALAERLGK